MNFKLILSTFIFSVLITGAITAQEENKKTVKKATIVKKMIDKDGNETIEKITLEGDEVDAHLSKMDAQIEKVEVIKEGDEAHIWITQSGERMRLNEFDTKSESNPIRIYKFEEGGDPAKINEGNIDVEVEHQGGEKIIKITSDGVERIIKVADSDEEVIEMKDGEHRMIIINTDDDSNQEFEIEIEETNDQNEFRSFIYEPGKPMANIPFLGIMMNKYVDHDDHGGGDVIITNIITLEPVPDSPADIAGIQNGDILFSLDDLVIQDIEDVTNYVKSKEIGDKVIALVIRDQNELSITITLGERPGTFPDVKKMSKEERFMRGLNPDGTKTKRKHHYGKKDNSFDSYKRHRIKRDPCKPFIGFSSSRKHTEEGGLEILSVIDDTPAKREGLLPGDLVLEMDGQEVHSHRELIEIRDRHDNGDRFKLLIQRNGKKMKIRSSFNDCPENENGIETILDEEREVITEDLKVDLTIFPNPTDGKFTLSYNGQPGSLNISITDISGKQLFEKTLTDYSGDYSEQIDLTDLADGTVIIQIENEGEILIEKLILQTEN